MSVEKRILPIFGYNVGLNDPIAMKLKLYVLCHIPDV